MTQTEFIYFRVTIHFIYLAFLMLQLILI